MEFGTVGWNFGAVGWNLAQLDGMCRIKWNLAQSDGILVPLDGI